MSGAAGGTWRGENFAALWQSLVEGRPLTAAATPLLADMVALAAAAMLLETLVLVRWHRRTGRGLPPRTLLPTMLAGGGLMLALHAALVGAPVGWLLTLLPATAVAHGIDLWRRWLPAAAAPARQGPAPARSD